MAYANLEYYTGEFNGTLNQMNIEILLEEASDQIDRLTYGRIRRRGFENLTEYQQKMIKKAVCYQAEFLSSYGEYLDSPLDGFSIGDVSLSFGKENRGPGGVIADKRTLDCLAQTGLTVRRF